MRENDVEAAIFPAPKRVEWTGARCSVRAGFPLRCPNLPGAEATLRRRLETDAANVAITATEPVANDMPPQAYRLTIEPSLIRVEASDACGVYYAAASLARLLRGAETAPCGRIEDWPDLAFRGVHLDLKRLGWNREYLKRLFPRLGALKINAVLLEYEDKFPYRSHPAIAVPSAFSRDDIAEFRRLAAENFIEIVPLVQSLGHLEYVLRQPTYASFSEDSLVKSDICPQNPAAVGVVRDMMEEVMAAHPESRWFHIGADEPFRLGKCPRCGALDAASRSRLYFDHVNLLCELAVSRGKIPMLWSDVLECHPELLPQLHPSAVVMYWDYRSAGEEVNYVINRLQEGGVFYEEAAQARLPENFWKTYRAYVDTGKMPKLYKSLPYTKYFRDQGREVVGATHVMQIENCRAHARRAFEASALGTVATAWSAHNSLGDPIGYLELRWKGVCAQAAFAWDSTLSREAFEAQFAPALAGAADADVWATAYNIVAERRDLLHPNSAPDLVSRTKELDAITTALTRETIPARLQTTAEFLRLALAKFKWEADLSAARQSLSFVTPSEAHFIDLARHANRAFKDTPETPGWSGQGRDENDLRPLPTGIQEWRGVAYRILDPDENGGRACLVASGDPARGVPREFLGVPVGEPLRHIFFLHALAWESLATDTLGRYRIHYADGQTADIPLKKDINIDGWWHPRDIADAEVAWTGRNRHADVGLYSFRWDNPRPEARIDTLDMMVEDPVVMGWVAATGVAERNRTAPARPEAKAAGERLHALAHELEALEKSAPEALAPFYSTDAVAELREFMFSSNRRRLEFLRQFFA